MSGKKKIAVQDLQRMKDQGRKYTLVTAYDYTTASIVDESDCEIILVGDSLGMVMLGYSSTTGVTMEDMIYHIRPVVKGAPNTFVVGDMPFGSYNVNCEQAIINATRMIKETGCDAVKLEGGGEVASQAAAIVRAGIPLIGHIGLTPQTAMSLGGFKVQGNSLEAAKKLIEDAKALESSGASAIVIECVPSGVTKRISESIGIPTMGIGAGPYCACQVLVTQDLLGMYTDFRPKFVKRFAHVREVMVEGLNRFHTETENGDFPTSEFSFNKEIELDKLY